MLRQMIFEFVLVSIKCIVETMTFGVVFSRLI